MAAEFQGLAFQASVNTLGERDIFFPGTQVRYSQANVCKLFSKQISILKLP